MSSGRAHVAMFADHQAFVADDPHDRAAVPTVRHAEIIGEVTNLSALVYAVRQAL
jgi:hypothetical protein